MATNKYFNNYYAQNEQSLIENMIIESIQMKGVDVVYFERTQDNIKYLFNEDSTNTFFESNTIEVYPSTVDGWGGEGEFIAEEGLVISKTATFQMSKKRFAEEFPDLIRPREGDILYMPLTKAILEIRYVNTESQFYEKGKNYLYEIQVETFQYSHEEFTIDDPETEEAFDDMMLERFIDGEND